MDETQEIIVGFGATMGFIITCFIYRKCSRRFQNTTPPNTFPQMNQSHLQIVSSPQPSAPQPYVVYIPNQPTIPSYSYPQQQTMYPPQQTMYPQQQTMYPPQQTIYPPQTRPYPKQV
jgi:hypothetical protein